MTKMQKGGLRYLPCMRFSDDLQGYPSVPPPLTSPERSAGVGGECTGQNLSFLPPRHSSITLPTLEAVWARAPAGLCWEAVISHSYPRLSMPPPSLF